MKRSILLLAAAMASVISLALPAQAQFGGCYTGVHAGGAVTASRGTVAGSSEGGAMTSGIAGAQFGCNGMVTNHAFIGAELSGDLYGLHQGSPVFTGTSGAELDRGVSAIVRAGYVFAPHTAAYVGAGYSWEWVSKVKDATMAISVPRADAPLALAGIEWRGYKHFSIDARYVAEFNRGEAFDVPGTTARIDSVNHVARLGFNWYFNEPGTGLAAKIPGKP